MTPLIAVSGIIDENVDRSSATFRRSDLRRDGVEVGHIEFERICLTWSLGLEGHAVFGPTHGSDYAVSCGQGTGCMARIKPPSSPSSREAKQARVLDAALWHWLFGFAAR